MGLFLLHLFKRKMGYFDTFNTKWTKEWFNLIHLIQNGQNKKFSFKSIFYIIRKLVSVYYVKNISFCLHTLGLRTTLSHLSFISCSASTDTAALSHLSQSSARRRSSSPRFTIVHSSHAASAIEGNLNGFCFVYNRITIIFPRRNSPILCCPSFYLFFNTHRP